ncbi:uncharacterized protein LOC123306205 isoform X2 [Chrysoperla carnea]|uniref:uncharacterized protein LOC123306205 isoform X2 n=1 Tax=Chrysoperla carnea TaxID=189513 RepID=UPI001D0612E6|nr:uncharacterized protein LOC123306205 isoform X2 [Chrysoperla carnea]
MSNSTNFTKSNITPLWINITEESEEKNLDYGDDYQDMRHYALKDDPSLDYVFDYEDQPNQKGQVRKKVPNFYLIVLLISVPTFIAICVSCWFLLHGPKCCFGKFNEINKDDNDHIVEVDDG